MLIELGHYSLILAFVAAVCQCAVALVLLWRERSAALPQITGVLGQLSATTAICSSAAFFALVYSFVVSDFSVSLVWQHSHAAKPLFYRISAVWGNHEGSLLLWTNLVTVFLYVAARARVRVFACVDATTGVSTSNERAIYQLDRANESRYLSMIYLLGGAIAICLLALVLFTSSPYLRQFPAPMSGLGLNPILQHPALAIHPPLLYGGHATLAVVFARAVAAIHPVRVVVLRDPSFRRCVLLAWGLLTAGISLGSWWAYHELGWGGWWFWDPVENVALIPWLLVTALLHCLHVVRRGGALQTWTIGLSLGAFGMAIVGTFLVRSGLLESVHSFASDTTRGAAIIVVFVSIIGAACVLYGLRYRSLREEIRFYPMSREALITGNNIVTVLIAALVLCGTLYPVMIELMGGGRVAVGAPYFHIVAVPLGLLMLVFMPIGPQIRWHRDRSDRLIKNIQPAIGIWLLFCISVFVVTLGAESVLLPLLLGLTGWTIIIGIVPMLGRAGRYAREARVTPSVDVDNNLLANASEMKPARLVAVVGMALSFVRNLRRSSWRANVAHGGLALAVMGMIGSSLGSLRDDVWLKLGQTVYFNGYTVTLVDIGIRDSGNFREKYARLQFSEADQVAGSEEAASEQREGSFSLVPSRRHYAVRNIVTTEMASITSFSGTLLAILDGPREGQSGVRIHLVFQPVMWALWAGATILVLIALSGAMPPLRRRREQHQHQHQQSRSNAADFKASPRTPSKLAQIPSKLPIVLAISVAAMVFWRVDTASAETLSRAEIAERSHAIAKRLRCPVCQGQPVSGSDAPLAHAMRERISEQVAAGASDTEIIKALEAVYGTEINTLPPRNLNTALLWLLPLFFISGGIMVMLSRIRR